MPTKIEPKPDLTKARKEGLMIIEPIKKELSNFKIKTEADYLAADEMYSQVLKAEKLWEGKISPIIEPMRQALDGIYALRREIIDPLTEAKKPRKDGMKQYKLAEAKRLAEAEAARQAEIKRLEDEARAKELAADKAKSAGYKEKLIEQRAIAEQKAEELRTAAPVTGVRGEGSTTRKVTKWKVDDLVTFMVYLLEQHNDDLMSLIQIDDVQMNAKFKLDGPKSGAKWLPGIEVYEDIEIAGRGR